MKRLLVTYFAISLGFTPFSAEADQSRSGRRSAAGPQAVSSVERVAPLRAAANALQVAGGSGDLAAFKTALKAFSDLLAEFRAKGPSTLEEGMLNKYEHVARMYGLAIEPWELLVRVRNSKLDARETAQLVTDAIADGDRALAEAERFRKRWILPTPKPAESVVTRQKFDASYRAARSLTSGLSVGISYNDFAQAFRAFATEVSLASDLVKTRGEDQVLDLFKAALDDFKRSLRPWEELLRYQAERDARTASPPDDLIDATLRVRNLYWRTATSKIDKIGDFLKRGTAAEAASK